MKIVDFKKRILLFFVTLLYCFLYHYTYIHFLFSKFEYFGYSYFPHTIYTYIYIYIISLLPIFWIKITLNRPSIFLYWFIYVLAYIPIQFTIFFRSLKTAEIVYISLVLFISFFIMAISFLLKPVRVKYRSMSVYSFWSFVGAAILILLLYVLFIFRNNLNFSALNDIYEQRLASDAVLSGNFAAYGIMLLGGCLFPFLIAFGLWQNKKIFLFFGFMGEMIMFMTVSAKSHLFSTIIILIIFVLVKRKKHKDNFGIIFIFSLCCITFLLLLAQSLNNADDEYIFFISSLFFLRIESVSGYLFSSYYDFFKINSYTYYSHIRALRWLIPYPYPHDIGLMVGNSITNEDTFDANACFWATDGIAAGGLTGVLIISIIMAIFLYFIDCLTDRLDLNFIILLMVFPVLTLLNSSFFTSMFSGGIIFTLLLIYLFPKTYPSLR